MYFNVTLQFTQICTLEIILTHVLLRKTQEVVWKKHHTFSTYKIESTYTLEHFMHKSPTHCPEGTSLRMYYFMKTY